MALLFIAPTWMLLLGLVVGLCRAARLGDRDDTAPGDGLSSDGRAIVVARGPGHLDAARAGAGRLRSAKPGRRLEPSFTKSLRRRAGLRRA